MTSNIKTILVGASICGSLLGFVAWRVHATRTQPVPQYEIVEDRSGSHPHGCSSLLGLAERVVQDEPAASRSQLTVLITGDGTTGNEPLRLAKYAIPKTRKAIEGRAAALRRQRELLADLSQKCESVRRTNVSPVFMAIVEALADLHAQGCKQNSGCRLYIDSDGEENVNKSMRDALRGTMRGGQTLHNSLDNSDLQVTFCGLAVTNTEIVNPGSPPGAMLDDPGRKRRSQDTWLSLFASPQLVKFEPYCPKATTSVSPEFPANRPAAGSRRGTG